MLCVDDDHCVFDGLESITIEEKTGTVLNSDGTVTDTLNTINVDRCLRREVTLRESIDSGGRLISGDVFWEVWSNQLPLGFVIKKAMVIIPDNNLTERWEILGVDRSTLKSRFRCHSRK